MRKCQLKLKYDFDVGIKNSYEAREGMCRRRYTLMDLSHFLSINIRKFMKFRDKCGLSTRKVIFNKRILFLIPGNPNRILFEYNIDIYLDLN